MKAKQNIGDQERDRVEYRLQERERFLRTLIGNLPGVVYRCRVDERFTSEFISDGCLELTGHTADELTQKRVSSWDEIIYADDRETVRGEIGRLMNDAEARKKLPLEVTYRIVNREGKLKYVRDRFRFIDDEGGKIIALEGFIADITTQTVADERLRESEAKYRLLAENMCDLVCLHDPEGKYLYVSPSSLALLGYAPEELAGKSLYDFIHPDEIVCVREDTHHKLLKGENNLTVDYRIRKKSGDYIWLESMAQTVKDKSGAIVQLLTVSRDFTTRKQAEKDNDDAEERIAALFMSEQKAHVEAKTARAEAEHANHAKDEFLQLISHEFRTPLTTIKMLARLMQKGGENEAEKSDYLETIAAECDRQIDMILNLLDVAKVEEGTMDLRLEPVDVKRLLETCDKIERHAANAREQKFEVVCAENLPPARGDAKAIRRALCSIIENAIKYTAIGGAVKLSARLAQSSKPAAENLQNPAVYADTKTNAKTKIAEEIRHEIAIAVEDTGRGIHAEDIPHLFHKFYRGKKEVPHDDTTDGTPDDAGGRAETPGVGLGLYLAKKLIKELGGRVEVESEVGRGSCFTVYLAVWNDATDEVDLTDEYNFDEGENP